MKTYTAGNLSIVLKQVHEKGTSWEVIVYKTMMGFKRRISSDWFLGEEQATKYAEDLARDLQKDGSTTNLTQRKSGWTLHRASH